MQKFENQIAGILIRNAMTLGVIESATGGLISHRITNINGSSKFFLGSVTAYSNDVKLKVIGVQVETLMQHGAVSGPVAQQMAAGGLRLLNADICLADTGIAGPGGGTLEKPVGLVYIAIAERNASRSRRFVFSGTREENKHAFAEAALGWLAEYLETPERERHGG
ncbi:MAG: CinA family protein [Dehalococcoidaceae bacterium]|nr:CinA family protein [Dehalococcoidaceae bacterium]